MKSQKRSNAIYIYSWRVAIMPDVHWGMATIGSVIPTFEAIIPAAVGVDIGCGMMAVQTTLTASDLPDNLGGLRSDIERAVPHGRSSNGRSGDRGSWGTIPNRVYKRWANISDRYDALVDAHPTWLPTASTTLEPCTATTH